MFRRDWAAILLLLNYLGALESVSCGEIISVEELETKLPNLLDIPVTSTIHKLLAKHRSGLFPSYSCTSIETCFGEEIAELRTALLENAGESDDTNVVADAEGIQASSFNLNLQSAVRAIEQKTGFIYTGKKRATHLVRAVDYLLSAFFLLRSRLREFRQTANDRNVVLSLMKNLFNHATEIASAKKHSGANSDRFGWLTRVREYRYYTHMNGSWRTLWFGKHPDQKLYTVPIPQLGSTFVTLWALAKSKNLIGELEKMSQFKRDSIKYWEQYPGKVKECLKGSDDTAIQTCLMKLEDVENVLTVKKAKFFVDAFAKKSLTELSNGLPDVISWIAGGMKINDWQLK